MWFQSFLDSFRNFIKRLFCSLVSLLLRLISLAKSMGCVHGKCCVRHPSSSDGVSRPEASPYSSQSDHFLTQLKLESVPVPSYNYNLEYSVLTQRGFYPDSPDKENEDSFCIKLQVQANPNVHFFGVFDGHGEFGSQCSNFVQQKLIETLENEPMLLEDPVKAYNAAYEAVNNELHMSEIDDTLSGTTAITVLLIGDKIYVANVGDSRAVIAVKDGNKIVAEDLSHDQTPFRTDECERVKACGARVLNFSQFLGLADPNIQAWADEEREGDPPRLWFPNESYPGTAFTRSIGDSIAEKIGVVAVPEVSVVQLTSNHLFFVVASDGVFQFLSSQAVIDMAAKCTDPRDACCVIAGESYKLWLQHEPRTDDITIIIVHVKDFPNSGADSTVTTSGFNLRPSLLKNGKGSSAASTPSGSGFFRSVRSDFLDLQRTVSLTENQAIAVSSLTHRKPLELDVGYRQQKPYLLY